MAARPAACLHRRGADARELLAAGAITAPIDNTGAAIADWQSIDDARSVDLVADELRAFRWVGPDQVPIRVVPV